MMTSLAASGSPGGPPVTGLPGVVVVWGVVLLSVSSVVVSVVVGFHGYGSPRGIATRPQCCGLVGLPCVVVFVVVVVVVVVVCRSSSKNSCFTVLKKV